MKEEQGLYTGFRLADVNGNLLLNSDWCDKGTWINREVSPTQDIIGLSVNRAEDYIRNMSFMTWRYPETITSDIRRLLKKYKK